jgi:hypothetical protein
VREVVYEIGFDLFVVKACPQNAKIDRLPPVESCHCESISMFIMAQLYYFEETMSFPSRFYKAAGSCSLGRSVTLPLVLAVFRKTSVRLLSSCA